MKKIKLSILLIIFAFSCLFSLNVISFASFDKDSFGIEVNKNVAIDNNYIYRQVDINYLTTTQIATTMPGTPLKSMKDEGFSGWFDSGSPDSTNNKSWNYANLLYKTTQSGSKADNSSIDLGDFIGNFSFIGRPIHTNGCNKSDSSIFEGDYTKFSITINDSLNQNNIIILSFEDSFVNRENANINFTVTYNGVSHSAPNKIRAGFRGYWNGYYNFPVIFKMDFLNKNIKYNAELDNQVNLDEVFKDFYGFEKFSAKLSFSGIKEDKVAKFIMHEIDGQPLVGETYPNTLPSKLLVKESNREALVNKFTKIPKAYAYQLLEGDLSDKITVQLLRPDGNSELVEDGFYPLESGTHTLIYSVKTKENIISTKSICFEAEQFLKDVEYNIPSDFPKTISSGSVFYLPVAQMLENKIEKDYFIYVQYNNKIVATYSGNNKQNKFEFTNLGDYTFLYVFINDFGYISSKNFNMTCIESPKIEDPNFPSKLAFGSYSQYKIKPIKAIYNGEEKLADIKINAPSGNEEFLDNELFAPKELGRYTVILSAQFDDVSVSQKYQIDVEIYKQSLFTPISQVGQIQDNVTLVNGNIKVNGVAITGKENNLSFKYNNVINLNNLDKETYILEFQPLCGDNYAYIREVVMTLTDVYNSKNTVRVKFFANSDAVTNQYTYVSVNYDGRYLGQSFAASSYGHIWKNEYGTTASISSRNVSNLLFGIGVDYEEKQFLSKQVDYITSSSGADGVVIDADDINMVGDGNAWKGFTTGEVYVSLTVPSLSSYGGILVTSVAGQSLSSDGFTTTKEPEIIIDNDDYKSQMPVGVKDINYGIPSALGNDIICGELDVKRKILYNNLGKWEETDWVDGEFIPKKIGEYKIKYSCKNYFGNTKIKYVYFEVDESAIPITVSFARDVGDVYVGDSLEVPEIIINGGNGIVQTFETDKKYIYDSIESELMPSRRIKLNKAGSIVFNITCKDYLGVSITKQLIIEVKAKSTPYIEVSQMPISIKTGSVLLLPDFTAIDFNYSTSSENFYPTKSIYINGVKISDERKYTVVEDAGTYLQIEFVANDDRANSVKKQVLVTNPTNIAETLLCSNNQMTYTLTSSYTEFVVKTDTLWQLPNALSAENLQIFLDIDQNKFSAGKVTITLIDFNNLDNQVKLNIYKETEGFYLQVNDGSKIKISDLTFIFNNRKHSILDITGKKIASVNKFVNGDTFNGFTVGKVLMTVAVESVTDETTLRFVQIGNQKFVTGTTAFKDNTAPQAVFDLLMTDLSVKINEDIIMSKISACDVLSSIKNITLQIQAPSGKVYNFNDVSKTNYQKADEYGFWIVKYVLFDENNNRTNLLYYFEVIDEIKPSLIINGTIPKEIKLGDKILIPGYTASDNYIDPTVYVIVVTEDGKYTAISSGEFVPNKKGKYIITITAIDSNYNYCESVFEVIVK